MGHVTAWIALTSLVVICAIATTLATRFAYGDLRSRGALSPADLDARFRRARLVGWIFSLVWIFAAILALVVFWPPTGWLVGALAGIAVLLVAVLLGLDHPQTREIEEGFFDE